MIQEIDVLVNGPWGASLKPRRVRVVGRDGIAIQRKFAEDDETEPPWHIIHMKTGLSLGRAMNLVEARAIQNFFIGLKVGGVKLADLPVCELCVAVPLLVPEFYAFITSLRDYQKTESDLLAHCRVQARSFSNALSCKKG